jgi:hypothetical protein
MANEPNHSVRVLAALEGIQAEMKEIKELLVSFTGDGWPLRSQLPSAELLASLTASLVVLLRDMPLADKDIEQRVMAAQVIAREFIKQHDAYNAATATQHLENLAQM